MASPDERKRGSVSSIRVSEADGRLQEMTAASPPFYKNRNLLILYLLIIPGGLLPSATLGFDSAMMNGLQAVPEWDKCKFQVLRRVWPCHHTTRRKDLCILETSLMYVALSQTFTTREAQSLAF